MTDDWRPSATLTSLRHRAAVLAEVRRFFAEREVLEVETPLLSRAAVTDPQLHSFHVTGEKAEGSQRYWLQTSPEFHMKRLLAAGSGSIFQICKAFRADECGRLHNPEFTLVEWYRVGFDHRRLMDEVAALVERVLGPGEVQRISYRQAFLDHVGLDPLSATVEELRSNAIEAGWADRHLDLDRDGWLDLILSQQVQPRLGRGGRCFLFGFPASQAALARLEPDEPRVARRFELFIDGVEIANGFHELCDPAEQRRRFERDRALRQAAGESVPEPDERLLAALAEGLPDCAGVALGFDRLLMVARAAQDLAEVMAFPAPRA